MSGPRQAGSLLRKYRLIKHVPVTYGKQGVGAPRYGGELPFTHEQWYKSHPEISLLKAGGHSSWSPPSFSSLTSPMEQLPMSPVWKSSLPAQNSVDQTHFIFDLHPEFLLTSHSYLLYMWGGPGVWARSLGRPRSVRPVSQSVVPLFSWSSHANVLIDQQRPSPSERSVSLQPLYRNSPGSPGSRGQTPSPIKGPCTVSRVRSLHSPSYFSVIPLSIMFFGEVERDGDAVWHLWPIWRSHSAALAGELFPAAGFFYLSFQAPRHHCGTFAVTLCS